MDLPTGLQSVANALEGVATWRQEAQVASDAAIADTQKEIENLETAIQNLQQQLKALQTSLGELESKARKLASEEQERSYVAIRDALLSQVGLVRARASQVKTAEQARMDAISAAMGTPAALSLKAKYDNFVTVIEPSLSGMDEVFREPMLAMRKGIVDGLDAIAAKADPGPVTVDGPQIPLDIVFSVDAPEGVAEIVMVVLPLPEEVKESWQDGPEDVLGVIAARASQVVYQACKTIGAGEVQAVVGGHQGRLAIEVELSGGDARALRSALQAGFDELLADVPEMAAAKITATARYALVDHLLPPEADDEA